MATLEARLRAAIGKELDRLTSATGILADARQLRLVALVGNGLSRLALRHCKGTDLSYDQIVQELSMDAGLASLAHLRARGYAVDEVFREAASRVRRTAGGTARIRRVFRDLWDAFQEVPPAPLHLQIAQGARAFITTNYDLLLEQALRKNGRYNAGKWPHPRMTVDSGAQFPFPPPNGYPLDEPPLYKIHGSFPDLREDGALPDSGEINGWLDGGETGTLFPERDVVVIDRDTYDYWSWYCPEPEFVTKFSGPLEVLGDRDNLIVPLGHGLSAEERILFRMRELVGRQAHAGSQSSARGLVPVFATEIDEPTIRLPYAVVRVHPALAGSPQKRELALMLLLDALAERGIVGAFREKEPLPPPALARVAKLEPRTIVMGQMALHTNRGYEDAPAQERAYSPMVATWAPAGAAPVALESREPFGDGLVPALLWDAIGLPCALEGRVGWDEAGRVVYDHLIWRTTTIDFSAVQQDGDPTEQATVASWFDLRLILDGPRRGAGRLTSGTGSRALATRTPLERRAQEARRTVPKRRGRGRFLYVTKPGWAVAQAIGTPDDLVVFDTGNNCDAAVIAGVLARPSVVIASALSLWMAMRAVQRADRADPLWKKTRDPEALSAAWEHIIRRDRPREEPKDETGRYEQFVGILGALGRVGFSLAKSPLGLLLEGAVSVSVSLGPLGVLWWSADDWHQAWWTRVVDPLTATTREALLTGQPMPLGEIRCGLGCGDSGRAGFAAVLELTPDLEPAEVASARERLFPVLARAYEAMAWWGASRLMFWGITAEAPGSRQSGAPASFCDWLHLHAANVRECLANQDRMRPFWPDGSTRRSIVTSTVDAPTRTALRAFRRAWDAEIVRPRRPKGGGGWVDAIANWRRARGMAG